MLPTRKMRKPFTFGRAWVHRVQARQRIGNAILAQIVAGRHLSAEAVASRCNRHVGGIVGRSLHQHGHIQPGQAQRIRNGALVAEVRQSDDHAVQPLAILLEQRGTSLRILVCFDCSVLGLLGREHHNLGSR